MLLVAEPQLGAEEEEALAQVVRSGWITMGDRVQAFEAAFSETHGAPDAVAVSSCTAGLHLALAALGIGPGDEVLVPSMSFVATANCVLYVGATPIFVDIEGLETPLMSLADAARKCTPRTSAIITMHYGGCVANGEAWREFARRRGLFLIEDAAHAAGADGAGSYGDAAIFSFYGNKNMTTAEGGMVLARDRATLDRIRTMRGHGMTSGTRQRLTERTASYDVTTLGWNYRMDELRAAIGLVQLKSLRRWNERRAELVNTYRVMLREYCPEVRVALSQLPAPSSHHLLPAVLPAGADRPAVMARMAERRVQTTVHYPPIHRMSLYRERFPGTALPMTEAFARHELTLPLHPKLSDRSVKTITMALVDALAAAPAVASR